MDINRILQDIDIVYKKDKFIFEIHKNIVLSQLVFEVHILLNDNDVIKFRTQYGKILQDMLYECFFEEFGDHLFEKSTIWFFVKIDNNIIAVLMMDQNSTLWNVCRNPDSEYVKYGIGKKLIEYTLKWSKRHLNTDAIYLYAWVDKTKNISRIKYYESIGFKIVHGKTLNDSPFMVYKL